MDEHCLDEHAGELPPKCIARLEQIRANWRETVEDLVFQFGYRSNNKKRRWLHTGGRASLKNAFEALGWDDPHYVKEGGCDHPRCAAWATCGKPTPDGYKHYCYEHYLASEARIKSAQKQPASSETNVNESATNGA